MTKELTPGQALDALIDGDTVVDSELRSEWTWPHCSGYELGEFCSFGPFTIKPKTSKLTAEMVVKASRGAKVYRTSWPDRSRLGTNSCGHVAMLYLTERTCRGYKWMSLSSSDFDADDWVMEE